MSQPAFSLNNTSQSDTNQQAGSKQELLNLLFSDQIREELKTECIAQKATDLIHAKLNSKLVDRRVTKIVAIESDKLQHIQESLNDCLLENCPQKAWDIYFHIADKHCVDLLDCLHLTRCFHSSVKRFNEPDLILQELSLLMENNQSNCKRNPSEVLHQFNLLLHQPGFDAHFEQFSHCVREIFNNSLSISTNLITIFNICLSRGQHGKQITTELRALQKLLESGETPGIDWINDVIKIRPYYKENLDNLHTKLCVLCWQAKDYGRGSGYSADAEKLIHNLQQKRLRPAHGITSLFAKAPALAELIIEKILLRPAEEDCGLFLRALSDAALVTPATLNTTNATTIARIVNSYLDSKRPLNEVAPDLLRQLNSVLGTINKAHLLFDYCYPPDESSRKRTTESLEKLGILLDDLPVNKKFSINRRSTLDFFSLREVEVKSLSAESKKEIQKFSGETIEVCSRAIEHSNGLGAYQFCSEWLPDGTPPLMARFGEDIADGFRFINASSSVNFPGKGFLFTDFRMQDLFNLKDGTNPLSEYKKAWPFFSHELDYFEKAIFIFTRGIIAVSITNDQTMKLPAHSLNESEHYSYVVFNNHFENPEEHSAILMPTRILLDQIQGCSIQFWDHSGGYDQSIRDLNQSSLRKEDLILQAKRLNLPVIELGDPELIGGSLARAWPAGSEPFRYWEDELSTAPRSSIEKGFKSTTINGLPTMSLEDFTSFQQEAHSSIYKVASSHQRMLNIFRMIHASYDMGMTHGKSLHAGANLGYYTKQVRYRMLFEVYRYHSLRNQYKNVERIPVLCIRPTFDTMSAASSKIYLDPLDLRMHIDGKFYSLPADSNGLGLEEKKLFEQFFIKPYFRPQQYALMFASRKELGIGM